MARRFALLILAAALQAQPRLDPGRSIGKVSTQGDLIVMELDDAALGKANLFDLGGRTLRFIPERAGLEARATGSAYRVENVALQWDSEFGEELSAPRPTLHTFAFPFSGKDWHSC